MNDANAPIISIRGEGFAVRGRLLDARQRVSDHLNEQRPMLRLADVELEGFPAFGDHAHEVAIGREAVVLVTPDAEQHPHADDMHMGRIKRHVRLIAGGWLVEGDVHLVPGVTLERFLNAGQDTFFPLTDARLLVADEERSAPVVLVHRHHVRLLVPAEEESIAAETELLGEAGAITPEAVAVSAGNPVTGIPGWPNHR